MREFVITADSNADLPAEYVKQHNLTIIPQYYAFGDTVYGDERNLPPAEFYRQMADGEIPSSMANNPEVIRERFCRLLEQDLDILHIAFSSNLSGSCNNVIFVANELMEEYPGSKITVIDSLNVSLGESLLVMAAMDQKAAGIPMDEIAAWLETNKTHVHVQFTVDDLDHLQRGGRISKAASMVLGIINIKPLLQVTSTGELASLTTVRGRKKSLSTLVANMDDLLKKNNAACKRTGIVHANCLADAEYMASLVCEKCPGTEIIINDISPSIGTHAGPGALGLCYLAVPNSQ